MMAPWSSCILISKPWPLRTPAVSTTTAGLRIENVPPCTIGRRLPHVVCSSVVSPLTKNIVAIRVASCPGWSAMPSGPDRISGIATVEPNIVR